MSGDDTTGYGEGELDQTDFSARSIVFYDGDCGLCHATVKFALERDSAARFQYAPLQGHTWSELRSTAAEPGAQGIETVGRIDLSNPPDSVLLLDHGTLLARTPAVVRLLSGLDAPWPRFAVVLGWIPTPIADLGYRLVAAVRRRLFAAPEGLCPLVPKHLSGRFLN